MEPNKAFGGFDIPKLLKACGLDQSCVLMADSDILRVGYPQEFLSAIYTASDVLLGCSYGEGFGVPVVEAQACGTRVITSGFAATQDLAGPDSWIVGGQPFLGRGATSVLFYPPFVQSMVEALKEAQAAPKDVSQQAIEFAKQFDVDRVWEQYWKPFWESKFDNPLAYRWQSGETTTASS